MKTDPKSLALYASGVGGFAIPTILATHAYISDVELNAATWFMVFALDVLGLILAFRSGNEEPWMQAGWVAAALCVVVAISVNESVWKWGQTETFSLVCFVCSLVVWRLRGAIWGLWPYVAASYIAFIPQLADYWDSPQPGTLYVWIGTTIACIFAIAGAPKRDFVHTFVPWACIVLNIAITAVILR